ncbi:MAG: REP-associated tyrosine transposase [Gaiellaceae bacterium]|nr:REP-associated tyrosine transposase [Gaiellaceae bacterium]
MNRKRAPETCRPRPTLRLARDATSASTPDPRGRLPRGLSRRAARGDLQAYGDYRLFSDILRLVVDRFEWRCHTYCLMPNHYHLLVETPAPNLSAGMQRLNSTYAQWFNVLHGFSGHVFERRFFSRLIESSYDLLELVRYIVLNPVRAGICDEAWDWKWSSYGAMAGETRATPFLTCDWLLAQFGHDQRRAREAFCTFIREAPPRARSH